MKKGTQKSGKEREFADRANRLYWESETSVNQIAEDLVLSKGALYALVEPLRMGGLCPECDEEVAFQNRTARLKNMLSCTDCGFQLSVAFVEDLAEEGSEAEGVPAGDARKGGKAGAAAKPADAPEQREGRKGGTSVEELDEVLEMHETLQAEHSGAAEDREAFFDPFTGGASRGEDAARGAHEETRRSRERAKATAGKGEEKGEEKPGEKGEDKSEWRENGRLRFPDIARNGRTLALAGALLGAAAGALLIALMRRR